MINGLKIISGGQSGVDRAALDFALKSQIPCGGRCPKGRIAEDGPIHPKYPLEETDSADYRDRTKDNVLESHGTLILYTDELGNGTALTKKIAEEYKSPLYLLCLNQVKSSEIVQFQKWLVSNQIKVLNIAGPRESNYPGIYTQAFRLLEQLF